MTLDEFNALDEHRATAALASCCGARRWATAVALARPVQSRGALVRAAEEAWEMLGPDDWREAIAHHPRIGGPMVKRSRKEGERTSGPSGWAAVEQSGAAAASSATRAALADGNAEYERRFGHRFIIRASGRSADEMLAALRERLANEPARELQVTAKELHDITFLRIEKLVSPP